MARNQWNAWTPEQDQRLRTLFEVGCSAMLVAAKLKRSLSATKARCRTLKISVKRKKVGLPVDGRPCGYYIRLTANGAQPTVSPHAEGPAL
jgi:hypothetical protein